MSQKLEAILSLCPNAMVVLDAEENIKEWNPNNDENHPSQPSDDEINNSAEYLESKVNIKEMVLKNKDYLESTDFKMTVDYFDSMTTEKQLELVNLRAEARQFIKDNEVQ